MGVFCPCVKNHHVDKPGKLGEFKLHKSDQETKRDNAACTIIKMYKKYKNTFKAIDKDFIDKVNTLPIENELVLQNIKSNPEFEYNKILNNAPRVLKNAVKLEGDIIYVGYWYR